MDINIGRKKNILFFFFVVGCLKSATPESQMSLCNCKYKCRVDILFIKIVASLVHKLMSSSVGKKHRSFTLSRFFIDIEMYAHSIWHRHSIRITVHSSVTCFLEDVMHFFNKHTYIRKHLNTKSVLRGSETVDHKNLVLNASYSLNHFWHIMTSTNFPGWQNSLGNQHL